MDSIALLIAGLCGAIIGAMLGFLTCAVLSRRARAEISKETWRAARRYFSHNFNLSPKEKNAL